MHSPRTLITTSKTPVTNWKKGKDCFKCKKDLEFYLQSFDNDFKLMDASGIKCPIFAKGAKVPDFKSARVSRCQCVKVQRVTIHLNVCTFKC